MESTNTPATAVTEKPRMSWLDANRVYAALGVVLIHSTTDASGQPFSSASVGERTGPALLRAVAELSGSEIFLVFSLFLLAFKLDKKPMSYRRLVAEQGRKILLPFVAWTVFYAFFRLLKANAFGYTDAIAEQLHQPASWVGYLLLGNAQYHLHFLPTLFCLVVLSPLMAGAARFPVLGLSVIGFLAAMETIQGWLWGNIPDPVTRFYVDQWVKNLCFAGYGLAGFAVFGLWKRRLAAEDARLLLRSMLLVTGVAFIGTMVYIVALARTGQWVARPGAAFYAHYLMPVLVFLCFFAAQHRTFSELHAKLAQYTLGLYLVHPIAIDVFDIAVLRLKLELPPTVMVLAKFSLVVPSTLGLVYILAKLPRLAWLVGLEARKRLPVAAPAQEASPKPA